MNWGQLMAVGLVSRIQHSFTHMTEIMARTAGRQDLAKPLSLSWSLGSVSPFILHVISKPIHKMCPEGMSNISHDTQGSKRPCSKRWEMEALHFLSSGLGNWQCHFCHILFIITSFYDNPLKSYRDLVFISDTISDQSTKQKRLQQSP